MMPASRATSSTSPLDNCRSRIICSVAGAIRMRPEARANRSVAALPLTSTMRLAPWSSKWDRLAHPARTSRCNLNVQNEFSQFRSVAPPF